MRKLFESRFPKAEIISCSNRQEAINVIRRRRSELSLVATDMDMRGSWLHMDGFALYRELQKQRGDNMPPFFVFSTSPLIGVLGKRYGAGRPDSPLVCIRKNLDDPEKCMELALNQSPMLMATPGAGRTF